MALQNLVDQLLCLSDVIEDKRSFHFAAHQHLLSASKSTNFLSEIVLANLVKPNFLIRSITLILHFPYFVIHHLSLLQIAGYPIQR